MAGDDLVHEWLEADGLGGFASGTSDGIRSRRYHALLLAATAPLLDHLDRAGLGHVSEIADAEPPHAPRGCPFQAWSVGEALRLERLLG
jgi:glycogen debranching enzyme